MHKKTQLTEGYGIITIITIIMLKLPVEMACMLCLQISPEDHTLVVKMVSTLYLSQKSIVFTECPV